MAKVIRTPGDGMKRLENLLKGLSNVETRVGVVQAATYEDGTPVAYIAAIQEFGSPERSIPPRATFRPVIAREQKNWVMMVERDIGLMMKGKITLFESLSALGMIAAGDVRKEISSLQSPPLSSTTLLLRKYKREGKQIDGKVVGEAHKLVNFVGARPKKDKSADISGVSTKPLVFDGILINAISSETIQK